MQYCLFFFFWFCQTKIVPNKAICASQLVSASDVTLTDRWLNVWCIWHTYLETLQECRSRRRIGWIIQDFWETCVSRSLTFRLETKMPWRQTPSRKKKAVVFTTVTTNAYQNQLNTGVSKVCEIFKVRSIESLKYVREFYTPVWYCGDISTALNMMQHKTKRDWLLYLSVIWPLQPSVWRSGYARLRLTCNTVVFHSWMNLLWKKSFESMIQWSIHPVTGFVSKWIRSFEWNIWMNDSSVI